MGVPEDRYLSLELSWLQFNRRVLTEAIDERTPLLERVKFLQIVTSNLDEFFMKRVGGLKRQWIAGVSISGILRQPPREQMVQIREAALPIVREQGLCFKEQIHPQLIEQGIHLLRWEELTNTEVSELETFFRKNVFPVLTPLSVDLGHPFPFISNLSTSFGVLLRSPDYDEGELFARIKVPQVFPTWIRVSPASETQKFRFISLYELIGTYLHTLFPGMEVVAATMFRITRNADIEMEAEDAEDLLEMVEEELRERRFAEVVRLEHGPSPNSRILEILKQELQLTEHDIYELPLWLEYFDLKSFAEVERPELRFPPWNPVVPTPFADTETSVFDTIQRQDVLVHHPYESFTGSVERFIRSAVEDRKVIAIKMTLYRTGDDSPFIPLLIRAAEAGKQVVCLVELKARFDEQRNILVAQELEKAGVHVVYGIVGLKTHCKVALVVRQETAGVQCYVHIGTGNYHSGTSRLYTDLGLFTAKSEFTEDVVHLFHYLTGRSLHWEFKKLLVAPIDMKPSFVRMVRREIDHAKHGNPAHIMLKLNNLEDREMIEELYAASAAGVRTDLIVRSVCCLRPQLDLVSTNIRVVSVVGRFLEHSRIFYFRNGAKTQLEGEFLIGSADWMSRNLHGRVEAIVPVEDPALKQRLWQILDLSLHDERQTWDMQADGTYQKRNGDSLGVHQRLMALTEPKRD